MQNKNLAAKAYAARGEWQGLSPETRDVIAACIARAEHFVLPLNGVLLDAKIDDVFKLTHVRLPYPFVTLAFASEYSFRESSLKLDSDTLIVAMEVKFEPPKGIETEEDARVFADDALAARYGSAPGMIVVHTLIRYRDKWRAMRTSPEIPFDINTRPDATIFMSNVGEGDPQDEETATQATAGQVRIIVDFLTALSCTNVHEKVVQPALEPAQAARRARKGKLPIFETKMLVIDTHEGERPAGAARASAERAGVRQHLRRGHIRRLQNGKNVWVNSHVVGDPSKGRIEKTYAVK